MNHPKLADAHLIQLKQLQLRVRKPKSFSLLTEDFTHKRRSPRRSKNKGTLSPPARNCRGYLEPIKQGDMEILGVFGSPRRYERSRALMQRRDPVQIHAQANAWRIA